jgi:hypothetical protein
MEKRMNRMDVGRTALFVLILAIIGGVAFAFGFAWGGKIANAAEPPGAGARGKKPKVVYPKKTDLDFEGTEIQGEIRNPGEFYFQRKPEEKFDSLVKRRPNFHREMLRDVVLGK